LGYIKVAGMESLCNSGTTCIRLYYTCSQGNVYTCLCNWLSGKHQNWRWRKHVPLKWWQHRSLSHGANTQKQNENYNKKYYYLKSIVAATWVTMKYHSHQRFWVKLGRYFPTTKFLEGHPVIIHIIKNLKHHLNSQIVVQQYNFIY